MKKVFKRRTRDALNGQLKRLFVADYHLARIAGLTRSQAFKICRMRYAQDN